jgi:hypothetical protein
MTTRSGSSTDREKTGWGKPSEKGIQKEMFHRKSMAEAGWSRVYPLIYPTFFNFSFNMGRSIEKSLLVHKKND